MSETRRSVLAAAEEGMAVIGSYAKECCTLTVREIEVASWIAEGKTNPEISQILGIATRTVEKHVEHILEKMGVENRTTAAVRLLAQAARNAL